MRVPWNCIEQGRDAKLRKEFQKLRGLTHGEARLARRTACHHCISNPSADTASNRGCCMVRGPVQALHFIVHQHDILKDKAYICAQFGRPERELQQRSSILTSVSSPFQPFSASLPTAWGAAALQHLEEVRRSLALVQHNPWAQQRLVVCDECILLRILFGSQVEKEAQEWKVCAGAYLGEDASHMVEGLIKLQAFK
eukprot:scaffold43317_cov14-Tisochrysis_lutea.AAC.1